MAECEEIGECILGPSRETMSSFILYSFITARFISFGGPPDATLRPILKKWVNVLWAPSREFYNCSTHLSRWICSTHKPLAAQALNCPIGSSAPPSKRVLLFYLLFSSRPMLPCRWTRWSWSSTCRPASTWTRRSTSSSLRSPPWRCWPRSRPLRSPMFFSPGGAVPEDQPGGARRQELIGEGHDRPERPLLHLLPHHQPSRQVASCCCRCFPAILVDDISILNDIFFTFYLTTNPHARLHFVHIPYSCCC